VVSAPESIVLRYEGDLNADTQTDIACIGTATANMKWYEHVGKK